jgi:hypothetical protein
MMTAREERTEILTSLREIKDAQHETNIHLTKLNGSVAKIQERQGEILQEQRQHCELLTDHTTRIGIQETVIRQFTEFQDERNDRAKEERSWLRDNVWKLAAGSLGIVTLLQLGIEIFKAASP